MKRPVSSGRFAPQRRRRSGAPLIMLLLGLALVGLLIWAATRDTTQPLQIKEIDVTNALPRR